MDMFAACSSGPFDQCTINDLPEEILLEIFKYYIKSEGVARIHNLSEVCHLWNNLSKVGCLWSEVDDRELDKQQLLRLSKCKLSQTLYLNLNYELCRLTPEELDLILKKCLKLKSVSLSSFRDQTVFNILAKNCPKLESVIVCYLEFELNADLFSPLLDVCGVNLTCIDLSDNYISNTYTLLNQIAKSCPNLKEFRFISCRPEGVFPISEFQNGCPCMTVLKLGNTCFSYSKLSGDGFNYLKSFACSFDGMDVEEEALNEILKSSTKLKKLNLEGCFSVTAKGLLTLSATDVEVLYLSNKYSTSYFGDNKALLSVDLTGVFSKWRHSLRDIKLSSLNLRCESLNTLIDVYESPLEELNLSYTAVNEDLVKAIIAKCVKLEFLNLYGCTNLPYDIQQVYRGRQKICNMFQ